MSHFIRVRPEAPEPAAQSDTTYQETKQLLKEHLLGTILERALDGMGVPAQARAAAIDTDLLPETSPQAAPKAPPAVASTVATTPPAAALVERQREHLAASRPASVGYYIYAVTPYTPDLWLAERGVDPTHPIYRYPFGKAQALISKVSLDEFGEKALQLNLNDQVWFRETVEQHNRVLAAIQSQGALVPMRVCTICDSLESLKAFLREHYDDFMLTLGVIEGKMEWELVISCNERKLRLLTEKASSRVRALQAEMTGKPADQVRPLKAQLEHVVAEEARSVCRACIRHSNGALVSYADGTAIVPVTQERDETGWRSIFHAAYLVNPEHTGSFARQVEQLQKAYESLGFDFALNGPMPAVHFPDAAESSRPLPAPAAAMLAS